MKRYKDISYRLARISPLREDKDGDFIRYEEVRSLVEHILDDCSLWDTKPEVLIKEWGE